MLLNPTSQRCQRNSLLIKGAPKDPNIWGVCVYLVLPTSPKPLPTQLSISPLCGAHFPCGLIQPQAATGNGESEELSIDRHKYLPSDAI